MERIVTVCDCPICTCELVFDLWDTEKSRVCPKCKVSCYRGKIQPRTGLSMQIRGGKLVWDYPQEWAKGVLIKLQEKTGPKELMLARATYPVRPTPIPRRTRVR